MNTRQLPYSEKDVSHDIYSMAFLFIDLMCQQANQGDPRGELIRQANDIARLGFDNSQNLKVIYSEQLSRVYPSANETLAFMEYVWDMFGNHVNVLRYDQFFQLLEKYDLVCGSFNRYTGVVPQQVLNEIYKLEEMWDADGIPENCGFGLSYLKELTIDEDEINIDKIRKLMRMPISIQNKQVAAILSDVVGTNVNSTQSPRTKLTDTLFIAAPAADMIPLPLRIKFETPEIMQLHINPQEDAIMTAFINGKTQQEALQLAMFAEDEIRQIERGYERILNNSDIIRYAKFSFTHSEPEIIRLLKDPFICSLTPYGVLIHAKWGEEAEDATIKRYEELRRAVQEQQSQLLTP